MKVALIHDAKLPVKGYGGTERVITWLSKGLTQKGHKVILVTRKNSFLPDVESIAIDFNSFLEPKVKADIFHYFATPPFQPTQPYVVTIGGNGQVGENFLRNTVFVSKNHAQRHGSESFVYNGIDPDEYTFSEKKNEDLVFLAKASWKVKNLKGAKKIARLSKRKLHVLGGTNLLPSLGGIYFHGMVGGSKKAEILSQSLGLLFPVLWDEPFGLAVIEALISGTAVVGTPYGSLSELITPEVGSVCSTQNEFLSSIAELSQFNPKTCRQYVMDHFLYTHMTENYLKTYEKVLNGEPLNPTPPIGRGVTLYKILEQ